MTGRSCEVIACWVLALDRGLTLSEAQPCDVFSPAGSALPPPFFSTFSHAARLLKSTWAEARCTALASPISRCVAMLLCLPVMRSFVPAGWGVRARGDVCGAAARVASAKRTPARALARASPPPPPLLLAPHALIPACPDIACLPSPSAFRAGGCSARVHSHSQHPAFLCSFLPRHVFLRSSPLPLPPPLPPPPPSPPPPLAPPHPFLCSARACP